MIEESLGDNRRFIESRDQKHVCAACCKGQSFSHFQTSEQESSPRMQMDRSEVEIEEARQTREREELHHRQRERRIRSHAYSVAQLVQLVRERTCETLPPMFNK